MAGSPASAALATRAVRGLLSLPEPVIAAFAGPYRPPPGFSPLDLRFRAYARLVGWFQSRGPLELDALRREPLFGLSRLDGDPNPAVRIDTLTLELADRCLAARFYRPPQAASPPPLLLFFHFGGCVIGSPLLAETACATLAAAAGVAVLSVAYRLAPEHPHPAALDDATDTFEWACANAQRLQIDGERIAVGGDSAGGWLAAALSVRQQHGGRRLPALQMMLYPVIDWDRGRALPTPFDDYYPLSRILMDWFARHYVGAPPARDPLLCLSRLTVTAGLPTALIGLAAHDLLHREGAAYAQSLRRGGVAVEVHDFADLPHAFSIMTGALPAAALAMQRLGERLGVLLRRR